MYTFFRSTDDGTGKEPVPLYCFSSWSKMEGQRTWTQGFVCGGFAGGSGSRQMTTLLLCKGDRDVTIILLPRPVVDA